MAPSSQAVSALRAKGLESDTVAGFLKNKQLHERLYGQYILVDEAGMCGTKMSNDILSLAKAKNARVLMCGDTSQHAPPAQYGHAMRILQEKAQVKTVTVNRILRQKNEQLRSAVESLAKNKTLEGFKKLEKMGAVKEVPEFEDRVKAIAEDYFKSVKARRSAIVISPTHAEADQVNAAIRDKLMAQKIIKGKERELTHYRALSFTEDQKKDMGNFRSGQILRFINNVKGNYRAGKAYEVIEDKKQGNFKIKNLETGERLPLPIEPRESFQVFQTQKILLAKGDRIRLTQNMVVEGSKMNNGTTYEIKGFSPRTGHMLLDNGKTLKKDAGHFRYAYCETSHSSQGKDADDVIVSVSDLSFNTASREQLYVSVSRGKHSAKIHTSDRSELRKAIVKTEQRLSARDIADASQKRTLERNRRNHHRSLNEKIREHGFNREKQLSASKEIQSHAKTSRGRE